MESQPIEKITEETKAKQENNNNSKSNPHQQVKLPEVQLDKNKSSCQPSKQLKRKKVLPLKHGTSEIEFSQEKRTRVEEMEQKKDTLNNENVENLSKTSKIKMERHKKVAPDIVLTPAVKCKLVEHIQTIQKLSGLVDQLRTEINDLKVNLQTEKSAVRSLR